MKVDILLVKHVAKLSKLPISEAEEELYSEQLSKILGYVSQLEQVDVSEALPLFNVTDLINVLAPDEISPSLTQEEALQNAAQKQAGLFLTQGVFKGE